MSEAIAWTMEYVTEICGQPQDVWQCPICGRLVTEPAERTYQPRAECWHDGKVYLMNRLRSEAA